MEKKLKPSMRENKRYLFIETEASQKEIEEAILQFIGSLGYGKAGIVFIGNKILAVNREEVDKVRAALAAYSKLIKVKKISGSIKKIKES
jgi:RNase P/RNase MRP subunit POP5